MTRPDVRQLSRGWKVLLLGTLYFSQGIPFGLFVQALPVLLREGGSSLQTIGLTSLLAIPWGLKFLWSPWVDQPLLGLPRRKGWLVPLQVVTMTVLAGLTFVDPYSSVTPLLAGILFVNFLNATQDIATDGLAVEILEPRERGLGNGLQVGGYRIGMIFGGAGALIVIDQFGWTPGLILCVAGLAVALIPLLVVDEPPPRSQQTRPDDEPRGFSTLLSYVREPGAGRVLLLLVVYKFGDALAGGMLRPMLVDHGRTMAEIGTIVGGVGFVAGLLGALTGGIVGDRMTRRRALAAGAVFQAIGGGLYLILAMGNASIATASWVVGIEHFTGGIATVVLFTCMMDWCRAEHTGADYTLLASTVVVATGLAATLSGFSAATFGYVGHFAIGTALAVVGGGLAVILFPTRPPGGRDTNAIST